MYTLHKLLFFGMILLLGGIISVQPLLVFGQEEQSEITNRSKNNFEMENTWQIEHYQGLKKYDILYNITGGDIKEIIPLSKQHLEVYVDPHEDSGEITINIPKPLIISPGTGSCYGSSYLLSGREYTEYDTKDKVSYLQFTALFKKDNPILEIGVQRSGGGESTKYIYCHNMPLWTKNDAKLWYEGYVSDQHFASMIQSLAEDQILKAIYPQEYKFLKDNYDQKYPDILPQKMTKLIVDSQTIDKIQDLHPRLDIDKSLPQWLKSPAYWWNQDIISDKEFFSSLSYLIDKGIIKVGIVSK